jgi:hypothetical protein
MAENARSVSKLAEKWSHIADALGLRIVAPFTLTLPSGARVEADVLLQEFGAPKGMLLVTEAEKVPKDIDAIFSAGYGCSVLSEPISPAVLSREDLESTVDVLRDWGWAGEPDKTPAWLREPST